MMGMGMKRMVKFLNNTAVITKEKKEESADITPTKTKNYGYIHTQLQHWEL